MRKILVAAVLCSFGSSAWAIDFTQPVIGLDKKPMVDCKEQGPDGKCQRSGPTTLGEIAGAALARPDQTASFVDHVKRGRLAEKIIDGKNVSLTAEEAKMIEDQLAKLPVSSYMIFSVVKAIDPAAVK